MFILVTSLRENIILCVGNTESSEVYVHIIVRYIPFLETDQMNKKYKHVISELEIYIL
jgi:hypothetical protein